MPYAIGLNSGSSFDGVDAVLIKIEQASDGSVLPPTFIDALSIDWPEDIQTQVLAAFDNKLGIFELTRLNYVCGAVFAQAALQLMNKHNLTGQDLDVIGYDGQTIYQEPPEHEQMKQYNESEPPYTKWTRYGYPCGLQIGEPGVVSVITDAPVVTQFRSVDHALQGTGAPLMQYFDYVLFRHTEPTATLNIGGISNCHAACADRSRMKAFDCGPGNVMIDAAMKQFYGKKYDKNGETAAKGTINDVMLQDLLTHPFFSRNIPRCAWRLDFGAEYTQSMLDKYANLSHEDILATLTAFTAEAITRAYKQFIEPAGLNIKRLIASGGGVRNQTLMSMIADRLPKDVKLETSDVIGIPPQYKEAVKFATIAFSTKRSIGDNIPAACGAATFGILGKLVLPPSQAKLTQAQSQLVD